MSVLDIDISLRRGDFTLNIKCTTNERITGLVGRSGSGKTTLLNAICGLDTPDSGRITIGDRVLFDSDRGVNLPPNQRGCGVVFQDLRLFPHLTVKNNILYGLWSNRPAPNAKVHYDVEPLYDLLELRPLLRRKPANLSGGEKQRVALGRALLSHPKLLLLDEPLAALDQRLKSQIIKLMQRVRDEQSMPMLYVCHDLAELQMMTDSAILMKGGTAVGCGALRDLAHGTESFEAAHELGLVNALKCMARERRVEDGLSILEIVGSNQFDAVHLRVPLSSHEPGTSIRAMIRPQDIALAGSPIEAISIQNQLNGPITKLSQHGGRVLVEVDLGQPVLVEITPRAAQALQLAIGNNVCCLIKSSAIEVVG